MELDDTLSTFSLMDYAGTYEVDYCVLYSEVLTLVEFKLSADKKAKHFASGVVETLERYHEKVNKYVVYLDGDNRENNSSDIHYFHIEEFLKNLETYIH